MLCRYRPNQETASLAPLRGGHAFPGGSRNSDRGAVWTEGLPAFEQATHLFVGRGRKIDVVLAHRNEARGTLEAYHLIRPLA